jgi:hypothetical protein
MTVQLPALISEPDAIDTIIGWIDRVAEKLTAEASRLTLRAHIRERVREGTLPAMQVIAAARAGHGDADLSLREVITEMIDRDEPVPVSLKSPSAKF